MIDLASGYSTLCISRLPPPIRISWLKPGTLLLNPLRLPNHRGLTSVSTKGGVARGIENSIQ